MYVNIRKLEPEVPFIIINALGRPEINYDMGTSHLVHLISNNVDTSYFCRKCDLSRFGP